MPPRLYLDAPLRAGDELDLPPEPARHVQVLRLQPGDAVTLFNGAGGEWAAEVLRMGGRQQVAVRVGAHDAASREPGRRVTLALGMPANERMDALIEKATELGVAAIQPLQCARSVLRLAGERAERRREHWQAVAIAAAEQSGRTRVPTIEPVRALADWLGTLPGARPGCARLLLSLARDAPPLAATAGRPDVDDGLLLSGPEGGLDAQEEALARQHGFNPASLGPRVLRADTAPLAALVLLTALDHATGRTTA
ncbi:16S rRNA (uracil(1498)-N(3))-methyltransferase [Ideonella sp.]|uniref:16S rRNA (uracil(1498)-N(3))-methyltransferase n=1 Tax=Ideonella sp. TaxID=1929293 RepID=UPI002B48A8C1|nr:16S rRNA (uracil(1498)-N(3))-methyltransferase [Ideonella sp.]HJV69414.1 16S rRNA (uracil(1498)-N(3))-methyltransferase [Ideonella sp.]